MREKFTNYKYEFLFSLLLISMLFLIYSLYHTKNKEKVLETVNTIPQQQKTDTKEIFTDKKDWYETSIEYSKENPKVKELILADYNFFLEDTKLNTVENAKDAEEKLYIRNGSKYNYIAEYKIATSSALGKNTISYIYSIYNYTGGAHGGTNIKVFNFDDQNNLLENKDILGDNILEKVSKIAFEKVMQEKRKRLFPDEENYTKEELKNLEEYINSEETKNWVLEGVSAKRENYENITLSENNLIIYFGQYQVGPYVEGIYEIKIPYTDLK